MNVVVGSNVPWKSALVGGLLVFCVIASPAQVKKTGAHPGQASVDYNRDVMPILSEHCYICHGPDEKMRMAKLRLDKKEEAIKDLGGGQFTIVPGDGSRSVLMQRIRSEDPAFMMPPPFAKRPLSKEQVETIGRWIDQGAEWKPHWAFIRPEKPSLPAVKNPSWPKSAIDYFVLARLEREGLAPSPEADRATLIRRLSLDLTGLPPTPKEVDDFLKDPSPNAYGNVVDRLLASPRYGERMAFRWLDAARYADTNGYQRDSERSMWRWRDWVIDAFNRNMPFDQFTVEQLAGDLLPRPTLDQRIATAFNRNHRTNSEGGIVPAEYAVEYVVDRVDTTATVFMGLTMGCARCHNHKYDPLTHKEYYQLYAYFNSIPEYGLVSDFGDAHPWMAAPTADQQRKLNERVKEIKETESRIAERARELAPAQRRWERSLSHSKNRQWFPKEGLSVRHALDKSTALEVTEPPAAVNRKPAAQDKAVKPPAPPAEPGFRNGTPRYVASPPGQGVAFDGCLFFDAEKAVKFGERAPEKEFKSQFTLSAWFYPESDQSGALITYLREDGEIKEAPLPKAKGFGIFFVDGRIHFNIIDRWDEDSVRVETAERLPEKRWYHVLAAFDSTQSHEKAQIYLNGRKQALKIHHNVLFNSFADGNANLRIGGGGGPNGRFKGMIAEVRIYKTLLGKDEIAVLSCPDPLEKIARIPPRQRKKAQALKLRNAFLEEAAPADVRELREKLSDLKQQKTKLEAEFPALMVMEEQPAPQPAFVLRRGAYDSPQERVERGVPAVLPSLPGKFPNNRLGLAKWLVSPDHPLTARVTVNRFWQMYFGVGLVKTAEDFGSQGERPSHPELLDWLATEFQRSGWNVKALQKLMVTSATYRQSSKASPTLVQKDPENRLLARGPRLRLSADMIRDQALFLSGLLVGTIGGPSVKPYQPPGLWKDMVFSGMDYKQDSGDNLWRRSLYTFWKRTILSPTMQAFDASARESCTVRETRTNTPLQALNLMNDVTYVEAARMLAQRMLLEGGTTPEERLGWAFRLATARAPDEKEIQILREDLSAQTDYFHQNPEEAKRLAAIGEKRRDEKLPAEELAAYAATASLILNLDEVITKQ